MLPESSNNKNQEQISYKIFFCQGDSKEVRRISLTDEISFEEFLSLAEDLFGTKLEQASSQLTFQYLDEEGDHITVSSNAEWTEAKKVQEKQTLRKIFLFKKCESSSEPQAAHCSGCRFSPNRQGRHCRSRGMEEMSSSPFPRHQGQDCRSWGREDILSASPAPVPVPPVYSHPLLQVGNMVHFTSTSSGKSLRIIADGSVDGKGRKGKWARFQVHQGSLSGSSLRFQNIGDSKHWLRITTDDRVDGLGRGGPLCEFQVVPTQGQDYVCLRSLKRPGCGVGILANGSTKIPSQTALGEPENCFYASLVTKTEKVPCEKKLNSEK